MNKPLQQCSLSGHILADQAGLRLDQALKQLFSEHSRSRIQQWVRDGSVKVNDEVITQPRHKVHAGDAILICATLPKAPDWQAQALPLHIVHEDDHLLIINKAPGMVVHPGAGNPDQTLVNALLHHIPLLAHLPRAGIIHRLDKDTSGLLIIAKTLEAHTQLITMMKARDIKRCYEAIVQGVMISGGTVDAPLGRHPKARTKMAIHPQGKHARTHYRVLTRFRAHTWIALTLETGRTHQIRVHMHHIRYPIVGDPTYARQQALAAPISTPLKEALQTMPRQALHARQLMFNHPITHVPLQFTVDLPEDMQALLKALEDDAHHDTAHH